MGLLIKHLLQFSLAPGAGVSTQHLSFLQGKTFSAQTKMIYNMVANIKRTVNNKRNYKSGYALN